MSIDNKVRLFAVVTLVGLFAWFALSEDEPPPIESAPPPAEEEPPPVELEAPPVEPEPTPESDPWQPCPDLNTILAPVYDRLNVVVEEREHAGVYAFCVAGDPSNYVRVLLFQDRAKEDCIEPETLLHEVLRGLRSHGLPLNRRVVAIVYCGPRHTDDLHVDVVLRHKDGAQYDPATNTVHDDWTY